MTLSAAALQQIAAADPGKNTWLSANAGSGKTRVLTDRVARLLLGGVQPQHILCLTYTKAAASEMQNRLFKRLGEWAMKPDDVLRQDLVDLGEADLSADRLSLARQLFALRTKSGLTQKQLAKLVGTTPSVISRLENADYSGHSLSMIQRVASAFDRQVEIRFVHAAVKRNAVAGIGVS